MTKTTENYSLPEALRNASPGRDEWRVQDPQTGAYCIAFSRGDGYTLDPEREAREWLAEQKARFPNSIQAGYVVAYVRVRTRAETLMQEAADEIDRLNALRRELQTEREQLLERCARAGMEARMAEGKRWRALLLERMRQHDADADQQTDPIEVRVNRAKAAAIALAIDGA